MAGNREGRKGKKIKRDTGEKQNQNYLNRQRRGGGGGISAQQSFPGLRVQTLAGVPQYGLLGFPEGWSVSSSGVGLVKFVVSGQGVSGVRKVWVVPSGQVGYILQTAFSQIVHSWESFRVISHLVKEFLRISQ